MTPGAVADVVVAGAGHNSLIAAAYLTRAGYHCRVLDARATPGGGVASEELLLDGFKLDSCSTGHTLIQTNPLLSDDELGLLADHGLAYIEPDPVAHVVFPDGDSLTMWLDLERTCEEIAYYSRSDAAAYRRLLTEYDAVKDVFNRQRFTPVGFGPSLEQMLAGRPGAGRWRRRVAMSAWRSCCGWRSRRASRSAPPARDRSRIRSRSAASGAAGRFPAAGPASSCARWWR
jgi:phytoene dehydrogenase-like protein